MTMTSYNEKIEKAEVNGTEVNTKASIKKPILAGISAVLSIAVIVSIIACICMTSKNGKLIKAVNSLQKQNPYIQLMVGEDQYIYLLYNKKGEAIAESSYGSIGFYRNDNKIITINNENVVIESDLNPIQFIKNAIKVASDNKDCTIESEKVESSKSESDKDKDSILTTLYTITLNGKDNVKKLYDLAEDEEYSTQSIDVLYSGFENVTDSKLIIKVSVGKNGEFGAACSMTFTTDENGEQEYTSWLFDGYASTFDWELGSDWYTEDTSDLNSWVERGSKKITEIAEKMDKYMKDNNLGEIDVTVGEYKDADDTTKRQYIANCLTSIENSNTGKYLDCTIETITDELNAEGSLSDTDKKLIDVIKDIVNNKGILKDIPVSNSDNTPTDSEVTETASETAEGVNETAEATNEPAEVVNENTETASETTEGVNETAEGVNETTEGVN